MKKSTAFILIVLCILSVFSAGCANNASDNSVGSSVAPTQQQNKFSSGDVLAKDSSPVSIAIAVASYDSTRDSYQIYDVTKNADGSWQISSNPSQRTLSRTAVEKLYTKKIGKIGSASSQITSSGSQSGVQPSYTSTTTSSSGSSSIQIRITYSGIWSGSYGDAGSMQSIDGSGSKIITISNPTYNLVSAAFQKKDGSQNEMKVEILKDGIVLNTGSTTAAYGVVAVSAMTNEGYNSIINPVSSKTVQIKVYYNGRWQGAYGETGSMQSVDGTGSQTYTITNPSYGVSASFQKKDGSTSEMRVEIIEDGNVLKSGSTTAAYGVVVVAALV